MINTERFQILWQPEWHLGFRSKRHCPEGGQDSCIWMIYDWFLFIGPLEIRKWRKIGATP